MKIMKKLPWAILFIHIILVIYVICTFKVDDITLHKGDIDSYDVGWVLIREDGSSEQITLPYYEECKAEEIICIKNIIPEQYWGKTLSFLTADKNMRIYIDGDVLYEFGVNDVRSFGKTPGSATHFVDIPLNLSRGEIVIEVWSPYDNYGACIDSMIFAERHIAILDMVKGNLLQFGCVIIMLGSCIVFCVLAWSCRWLGQKTDGTGLLAVYCFQACIYYAIETKAMNIIYGNQTLYSVLVFLLLMGMTLFMLTYYLHRFPLDKSKSMFVILLLAIMNACVQIPLQILNIKDFMDMAVYSHGIMFASVWILLGNLHVTVKKEAKSGYRLEYAALIGVGVCALVDIVRSYTEKTEHIEKFSRYGTTLFCFLMLLSHIIQIIRKYAATVEENAKLLAQKVELAERKNEAKSIFLARMSHEIRTPINAVLGMNQMIMDETQEPSIREYAKDVENAAGMLLGILNEILDLSKIEAGKMTLVEKEYSLSDVINSVAKMMDIRAKAKNLKFKLKIDEGLPDILYGDELKLRQILTNLLSNAIKYTEEGYVQLAVRGQLAEDKKTVVLMVRIMDSGIGIREEDLPKLFDAFERFEEERNSSVEGTGLGLNITMQFLKMMGSRLEVDSQYGMGSTFYFALEQKVVDKVIVEQTPDIVAKKILLVDDNSMNRKVFRTLLKGCSVQIIEADSGAECLEATLHDKYDVIFMDHMMPNMNGIETLKRLKSMEKNVNKNTKVIALTATDIPNASQYYCEVGFDGYLAKPINKDELLRVLGWNEKK